MQLLSPINVIYYVTTYLKGGAIENQTTQPVEKPFPNPNMGSFDSGSSFSDLQLEWLVTRSSKKAEIAGIPSGKHHQIGDNRLDLPKDE
jgi:hypothetical protein